MRYRLGLFLAALLLFVSPSFAHAAIPFFGPIIPADSSQCAAGFALLIVVINRLISFFITLAIVFVAPLMIAYAGFLFVVNPVNASGRETAKHILWNTVIGIALALGSWLIVDAVMAVLYNPGAVGSTWSSIVTGGDSCIELAGSLAQVAPGAPVTTAPYASDEQSIRARLAADGVTINNQPCDPSTASGAAGQGCTNVANMQADTVQQIINLADACGGSPGLNGCGVVVTGGTEPGHAAGTYSHGNGYKVDIRPSSQLNSYIQNTFTSAGTRTGDHPGPAWTDSCGNQYVLETASPSHWDITVKQACGTKAATAAGSSVQCPAPSGPTQKATFAGAGNHVGTNGSSQIALLPSGTTLYLPLPAPYGQVQATYTAVSPPSPATYEISVNQCPGVITTDPGCYFTTTNEAEQDVTWGNVVGNGSACRKATNDGTWYANIRYTYSGTCNGGLCGQSLQWNPADGTPLTTSAPQCPAPPANMVKGELPPLNGVPIFLNLASNQVISFPLPKIPTGHARSVELGETPRAHSPDGTIDISISACQGYIPSNGIDDACTTIGGSGHPGSGIMWSTDQATANTYLDCLAPEDVQRYVNIREVYTQCASNLDGSPPPSTCGYSLNVSGN